MTPILKDSSDVASSLTLNHNVYHGHCELDVMNAWLCETCDLLDLSSQTLFLAQEYLSTLLEVPNVFPSVKYVVCAPVVIILAAITSRDDISVGVDFLAQLTGNSCSTDDIRSVYRLLSPYREKYPHPSLLYSELLPQLVYNYGICTTKQQQVLKEMCFNKICQIPTETLNQLSSIPLVMHTLNACCQSLHIPAAVEILSKVTGYDPNFDLDSSHLFLFLYNDNNKDSSYGDSCCKVF
ncbi:hypothetical protein GEMRC1_003793 [Eukaryota sp. GEM-RC1]